MLGKILDSNWFIPGSIVVLGGVWFTALQGAESDIEKIESKVQTSRAGLLHEYPPQTSSPSTNLKLASDKPLDRGQAPLMPVARENMYPGGNPPYRNIFRVASARKGPTKKSGAGATTVTDSGLRSELEAMKMTRRKNIKLPRSLQNPNKRQKALKMLTDTYQVFNRHIKISSQTVQDAMDNGSRTEKEINEALEAIEQMKKGRRMLIEKIQAIEEASDVVPQDEAIDDESVDQFLLPEEE